MTSNDFMIFFYIKGTFSYFIELGKCWSGMSLNFWIMSASLFAYLLPRRLVSRLTLPYLSLPLYSVENYPRISQMRSPGMRA